MTSPPPIVPLATLADLGITSHRGWDWARDEIVSVLADAGCPAPPDGPASDLILEIAGMRLARAIGFLVTEQASFVTGQVLVVDGGITTTTL